TRTKRSGDQGGERARPEYGWGRDVATRATRAIGGNKPPAIGNNVTFKPREAARRHHRSILGRRAGARSRRALFLMAEPIIYDLMLLLSSSADEERRAKILADVEEMITTAGGQIERSDDWGMRTLAFEINHQTE